ncbi:MAG: L,D-transpeptidase family protein, partial [Patescibacteria group bacterium]
VKEFPIVSKGREGSWWETPAGLYQIQGKERNHYSSFAGVYLPWSMPFQGNFFIHGWPYYPDGTPVSSTYSGGCIRLRTEDAEAVYKLVKVGEPVLVFEKDFEKDDFSYSLPPPNVGAESFLIADLNNNFVVAEKWPDAVLPIASITKLLTATTALEYMNIEGLLPVGPESIVPTSVPRLKAGQSLALYDLLMPLLMESSNEAAEVMANFMGRERFVELVNEKAKAFGMENTVLADASGRANENVASAQDLFRLAKHLYFNRRFVLNITAGKLDGKVYGESVFRNLKNLNLLAEDPDFVGGKIGKSGAAGEAMLSVFELSLRGEKRPVAIIVLRSPDVYGDVSEILNWLRANFTP